MRQELVKTADPRSAAQHADNVTTHEPLTEHLSREPGPRLFVALWGGLAVVDVSRAGHLSSAVQVGLLAALAAVCAVGQQSRTALAVAGIVWLVLLGFVVNRDGALDLTGIGDVAWLVVVVVAAVVAARATR